MPNWVKQLHKKRHMPRWYGSVVLAILVFLMFIGGGLVWAGRNLPPPRFGLTDRGLLTPVDYPLWRQVSDWLARRKYIMLTFDDGPYGYGVDEKIIAILEKHGARAVFFEVCAHINDTTREVLQKILVAGNVIANHSYDHEHLPDLKGPSLKIQIEGCNSKLAAASGLRPTLFRPPFGQLSPEVVDVIRASGLQLVLWDANSGDSWLKEPQKIIEMSLYEASLGGSILLMHSRPTTADALDELLTKLRRRGYRFALPGPYKKNTEEG